MSICNAASLFLALYAGYYSVVLASKDWFDARFHVEEDKIDSHVERVVKCNKDKEIEVQGQADSVKKGMCRFRFWLFLPTGLFFFSTICCTVATIFYFEDENIINQAVYILLSALFILPMLGSLMCAWWCRREAFNEWERLKSNLRWAEKVRQPVPNVQEYEGLSLDDGHRANTPGEMGPPRQSSANVTPPPTTPPPTTPTSEPPTARSRQTRAPTDKRRSTRGSR